MERSEVKRPSKLLNIHNVLTCNVQGLAGGGAHRKILCAPDHITEVAGIYKRTLLAFY